MFSTVSSHTLSTISLSSLAAKLLQHTTQIVWGKEREREREIMRERECEWVAVRERECVCVCVCVRVCVWGTERVREWERVWVNYCMCMWWCWCSVTGSNQWSQSCPQRYCSVWQCQLCKGWLLMLCMITDCAFHSTDEQKHDSDQLISHGQMAK